MVVRSSKFVYELRNRPAAIAGAVDDRATLVDVTRAVTAVGRYVGPAHAVVGHSMGAAAAALATTGWPRRLGLDDGPGFGFGGRLVLLASPDRLTGAVHAWAARTGGGAPRSKRSCGKA